MSRSSEPTPARALPPWWAVLLVAVAVAALAFAIGRFSTFGAGAAGALPGTDSPEAGFARDMQVHHAQAVEMAMDIYRTTDEIDGMRAATGTDADCRFLSLMIRHHEGALPMAQALVDLGNEPRAIQVAQGVIATQSAEIDLMTSLQKNLACAP